jgi:tRNA G10  N-methylase Trm11
MLNLAAAEGVVLDPFCGTGVVLQEALLQDHDVYGTDLEEKMIQYTDANLKWLKDEHSLSNYVSLESGDARTHQWKLPFDTVVSETFLGTPLSSEPTPNHLSEIRSEVNKLISGFLSNMAFQSKKGMNLCIAVPAWFVRGKYTHLKILDDLEKLGYTRRVLKHASNEELIYRRKGQIVARELLILERT